MWAVQDHQASVDASEREISAEGNAIVPYSHAQAQLLMLTRSVTIFQHPDSSGVQQLHMSGQLACDGRFVQTHTSLWCV